MPLNKPYSHIYRHGASSVIQPYYDNRKSDVGINFIASYEILKQDLKSIFEYIEPCGSNFIRYSDLNAAMQLSEYEVLCYGFNHPPFIPFASFSNTVRNNRSPDWYKAYNSLKHNRTDNFNSAFLENVIQAIGAIYVFLVAQFGLGFDHKIQLSYCSGGLEDWDTLKNTTEPYISFIKRSFLACRLYPITKSLVPTRGMGTKQQTIF